jgi:hypothetical protein
MNESHRRPLGHSEDFLARDFYFFLLDPRKGGYRASKISPTRVRYYVSHYQVEVNFTGSFQCQVEIEDLRRENLGLEEKVGVPYDGRSYNNPNWSVFFREGIGALIRERLADSK